MAVVGMHRERRTDRPAVLEELHGVLLRKNQPSFGLLHGPTYTPSSSPLRNETSTGPRIGSAVARRCGLVDRGEAEAQPERRVVRAAGVWDPGACRAQRVEQPPVRDRAPRRIRPRRTRDLVRYFDRAKAAMSSPPTFEVRPCRTEDSCRTDRCRTGWSRRARSTATTTPGATAGRARRRNGRARAARTRPRDARSGSSSRLRDRSTSARSR